MRFSASVAAFAKHLPRHASVPHWQPNCKLGRPSAPFMRPIMTKKAMKAATYMSVPNMSMTCMLRRDSERLSCLQACMLQHSACAYDPRVGRAAQACFPQNRT